MENLIKFLPIVCLVLVFAMTPSSYAAGEWSIGGDIGFYSASQSGGIFPDGSNLSTLGFGAELDYVLNPIWEVGIEYIRSTASSKTDPIIGITEYAARSSRIMMNLLYHFSDDLSPLYIGAKIGLGTRAITATGVNVDLSAVNTRSFAFGATAGYDYMFKNTALSVGPKADFVVQSFSPASVTNLDFLVTFKYHL